MIAPALSALFLLVGIVWTEWGDANTQLLQGNRTLIEGDRTIDGRQLECWTGLFWLIFAKTEVNDTNGKINEDHLYPLRSSEIVSVNIYLRNKMPFVAIEERHGPRIARFFGCDPFDESGLVITKTIMISKNDIGNNRNISRREMSCIVHDKIDCKVGSIDVEIQTGNEFRFIKLKRYPRPLLVPHFGQLPLDREKGENRYYRASYANEPENDRKSGDRFGRPSYRSFVDLMLSLALISSASLAIGRLYLRFIFGDECSKDGFKNFYLYAIAIGCGFYGFVLFALALSGQL